MSKMDRTAQKARKRRLENIVFGEAQSGSEEVEPAPKKAKKTKIVKTKVMKSSKSTPSTSSTSPVDPLSIFAADTTAKTDEDETTAADGATTTGEVEDEDKTAGAAWVDSDDEDLEVDIANTKNRLRKLRKTEDDVVIDGKEYEKRLRETFTKQHGQQPDWATKKSEEEEEEEARLLRTAKLNVGKKIRRAADRNSKSSTLPADVIEVKRLENANKAGENQSQIEAMGFHKNGEIFFTAGKDKTLRIFHIDGKANAKVASYHFEKFPITEAAFTSDYEGILISGYGHRMFRYDIKSGQAQPINPFLGQPKSQERYWGLSVGKDYYSMMTQNGHVCIIDSKSNTLVTKLKMNAAARALCWHPDAARDAPRVNNVSAANIVSATTIASELESNAFNGNGNVDNSSRYTLYGCDREGYIYEWDLSKLPTGKAECVRRYRNEQCVELQSLASCRTPEGKTYLFAGTSSGTVDVFDLDSTKDNDLKMPKIVKTYDNLQHTITSIDVHPSGQIVAFSSLWEKNAIRIAHLQTHTVFQLANDKNAMSVRHQCGILRRIF